MYCKLEIYIREVQEVLDITLKVKNRNWHSFNSTATAQNQNHKYLITCIIHFLCERFLSLVNFDNLKACTRQDSLPNFPRPHVPFIGWGECHNDLQYHSKICYVI